MTSSRYWLSTLLWVLAGTLILMVPAFVFGRPFVFWDTSTYYGWGHDIVAAMREPWPDLAHFPAHRGMWAMDHTRGAWDRVTPQQFQLIFTYIGARSEFYAVPLYLLGSWLTLWAPAILQALAASSLLWIATAVLLDRRSPLLFAVVVVVLTAATPLGFYTTLLMPDVFAGLGLLAAALLLCYADRMSRWQRAHAATLITVAVAMHTSNVIVIAALLLIAVTAAWLLPLARLKAAGFALVGCALAVAVGAEALSKSALHDVFGQRIRTAPFLEGRVITDGPGRLFLQQACRTRPFAACLYKDMDIVNADDIIWPDDTLHDVPLITDPAERHRFLDEQTPVVIGTLLSHPFAQLIASAKNAAFGVANFRIVNTIGYSLSGLIRRNNDQTRMLLQIVPNLDACLSAQPPCYYEPQLRPVQWLQYIVTALAFAGLGLRILQYVRRPERVGAHGRLILVAVILAGAVVVNGAICGAAAGPWERYQARVIWLVPMAFGFIELRSALDRARKRGADRWPSRPSVAVG
ncbi:MAG: hypothetical protein ACM30I_03675 [Gemmatimonas sp.]